MNAAPRDPVISASGLTRNCRHHKVLEKRRPRHPATVAAMHEGVLFGSLVQEWIEGRLRPEPDELSEPWRWFHAMRDQWTPPPATACEVPLGLSTDGMHAVVVEMEPHIYTVDYAHYVAPDAPTLLTAGRADLVWTRGQVGVVGDLKRSAYRYGEPGRHPQLMALGLSYALREGTPYWIVGLWDARDSAWEWSELYSVADDGPAILEEVREMATMSDDPNPGDWCAGCYESRSCRAFNDNARRAR